MRTVEHIFSDELVRALFDHLGNGVIITDENCIVKYVNNSYMKFHDILPEDIINKNLLDVRPKTTLPGVLRTRKPILNALREVGKTKSYCDMLPLIHDGKLFGGMVIVKDILAIKDLSEQLVASKTLVNHLSAVMKTAFSARYTFNDIIGSQQGLRHTIELGYKAAQSDASIFLVGESGSGKEVLAQAIHNASRRNSQPFVDVNCAALPDNLLESELFGYAPGAFTGASKGGKVGLFEIANGGTLFLDEITEMPLNLQSKLLRALQEKRILRLGSEQYTNLDIRVIAASNKNIAELVKENKFRDDLYFRLAVFMIQIPPLRERVEDFPLLVNFFIEDLNKKYKGMFSVCPEAMTVLASYNWPGNIRELKNALEYACSVTNDFMIKVEDLPLTLIKANLHRSQNKNCSPLDIVINDVEKKLLQDYLLRYGTTMEAKEKITSMLKISMSTLYNKMRKYDLL